MSGLSRKIHRNKVKAGKARPALSKLDTYNSRQEKMARGAGENSYLSLHETKGFQKTRI